ARGLQGCRDGLGPPGARGQHGQPARIEAMDPLAHSLVVAADRLGDLNGALAAGGSEQDLGAAEDKGIGRAQAGLQRLALGGRERPHIDRRSHANKYQAFPPILAGTALGLQIGALVRLASAMDSESMQDRLEFLSNWMN